MINRFDGEYFFLSNFYPCIVMEILRIDNRSFILKYNSSEAYFQAQKCSNLEDKHKFTIDGGCDTASKAKRLGRHVQLREDWDTYRLKAMTDAIECKFLQNYDLFEKLMKTKDHILIEGNTWGDKFWGQVNGVGENHLGKTLMRFRDNLYPSYLMNKEAKKLFEVG